MGTIYKNELKNIVESTGIGEVLLALAEIITESEQNTRRELATMTPDFVENTVKRDLETADNLKKEAEKYL